MQVKDCIKWLWSVSKRFRFRILWNGMIGILRVAVSLSFIWVCKCLIDIVTRRSDGSLDFYIGWMVFCMLMQLCLSSVGSRLGSRQEICLRNELRGRLFARLMESRWMGQKELHTGDMLNRLMEDVLTVTDILSRGIPSVMVTAVQLAGAFFFLFCMDEWLAGIVLFIMPAALLLSKSYVRKMRRLSREIRAADSHVQSHIQEYLQHRTLVRTLEYTARAVGSLTSLQSDLQCLVMRRTDFSLFSRLMVQLGFSMGYMTAFLWGIFGLRDGIVTFGMMTAFLQLVAQVRRPIVELSRQIPAFVRAFTSIERLEELSSCPLEQQGEPIRLAGPLGVRLVQLEFAYPGSKRKIFQNFTYDFVPGSLTAVIGETGAGKSTLLRLVLALLLPDSGKVVFYNEERETEASPLTRCNLSYVPQGNTLISGTIRENLLMGNPDATEQELHFALHTAAADFVYALPDGLDTLCGEQGAGLSEGQAQRIAIARGLLRPGSVLLLDEPTSSLDGETEKILLERLSRQVKNKTLILITHRELIVRLCPFTVRIRRNTELNLEVR